MKYLEYAGSLLILICVIPLWWRSCTPVGVEQAKKETSHTVATSIGEQARSREISLSGSTPTPPSSPVPSVVEVLPGTPGAEYIEAAKKYIETVEKANRDPSATQKYSRTPLDSATIVVLQDHLLSATLATNRTLEENQFKAEPVTFFQAIRRSALNPDEQQLAHLIPLLKLFRFGSISKAEAVMVNTIASQYYPMITSTTTNLASNLREQAYAALEARLMEEKVKSLNLTEDQATKLADNPIHLSNLRAEIDTKLQMLDCVLGVALRDEERFERARLYLDVQNRTFHIRTQHERFSVEAAEAAAREERAQQRVARQQEKKSRDVRYIKNADGTLTEIRPSATNQ